jgi:hypothetical protein
MQDGETMNTCDERTPQNERHTEACADYAANRGSADPIGAFRQIAYVAGLDRETQRDTESKLFAHWKSVAHQWPFYCPENMT